MTERVVPTSLRDHLRWLGTAVQWAAVRAGYWARPYDSLLDARRWRWEPRGLCSGQMTPLQVALLVQREQVRVTSADVMDLLSHTRVHQGVEQFCSTCDVPWPCAWVAWRG